MKATVLYRIACVLLILFAAGHTVGFLTFKAPSSEARAVWDTMNNVHFQVRGASFSYGGFYIAVLRRSGRPTLGKGRETWGTSPFGGCTGEDARAYIARRSSVRFVRFILHPRLIRNPVYFPGLAAIIRE